MRSGIRSGEISRILTKRNPAVFVRACTANRDE
jgi:hypothetical protein